MSFETLKVSELKKIAEDFGVDIESLKNKADIIAALSEEGVSWSVYKKTLGEKEEAEDMTQEVLPKFDPKKDISKDAVLVKMERANFRYDILGHTFTREHPFVAMAPDQAQAIFDKEDGFRLATPKEVQDFYH
jgi:alpha-ketoglutarate-dependent taurine dioxygenase